MHECVADPIVIVSFFVYLISSLPVVIGSSVTDRIVSFFGI